MVVPIRNTWFTRAAVRLLVSSLGESRAVGLGVWLFAHGRNRAAAAILTYIVQAGYACGKVMAVLAASLWDAGERRIAREAFEEALRTGEDQMWVRAYYGSRLACEAVASGGDRSVAAEHCRLAYQLASEERNLAVRNEVLMALAACVQPEHLDEAEGLYQKVLADEPSHAMAMYGIGMVRALKGDWEGALGFLAPAVQANPRHADAQYELGNALCCLNRWAEAEGHFTAAVALAYRDRARALYGAAMCRFMQGDELAARVLAERSLEASPDYEPPRTLLEEIAERRRASKRGRR
jgi:tetratricopeptide (TPR) repeat protein